MALTIQDRYPDQLLESFLLFSGFIPASIAEVRVDFPRWRRILADWGIEDVPTGMQTQDPAESYAISCLTLLALQARRHRDPRVEHHLRNLVGVRPERP